MRTYKHIALFLVLSFGAAFNAFAALKHDVIEAISAYQKDHTLNATYLFAHGENIITKSAHGEFSFEQHTLLKPNQQMPVASCTKPMTAVAILMLRDRGLLDVYDTIAKVLPAESGVWPAGKLPEWAYKITLHQLLTHTSGLAEYIPALTLDPKKTHQEINMDILKFAVEHPLVYTPGKEYSYCNTGFVILGLIIENLSKKTFAEFLRTEMFEPLGMKHTLAASTKIALEYQQGKLNHIYPVRYFAIPTGAKPIFTVVKPHFFLSPFADGGVISDTYDLYKWNRGLHEGKLLSEESYKMMTTPYVSCPDKSGMPTEQGYGLFISKMPNGQILYHHGGNAIAIRAEYGYVPASKFYFAILSNVMVHVPDDMQGKVDFNLSANQIDILYFRNDILKMLK